MIGKSLEAWLATQIATAKFTVPPKLNLSHGNSTLLNRIVRCRYRKWGTHVNNVGIAIINHPHDHHTWVVNHQQKWLVYDIAIPTLPNFKTGPCRICAGSIGVPLAPGQSRVML